MAHIPSWCGVCKGTAPHYFCNTEQRYTCEDCVKFCHKMTHNWRELSEDEKEQSRINRGRDEPISSELLIKPRE